MIRAAQTVDVALASHVLHGLVALETGGARENDLCLELGLSLWMRRSGVDIDSAWATVTALPRFVAAEADLDPRTEPIPLVGRSMKLDLINVVVQLGQLIPRAARSAGCTSTEIVERSLERLVQADVFRRKPAREAG
jgi:hypothetical protein